MKSYLIREENMECLEKKLATIQKKCKANKCSFIFNIKDDDIYKKVSDEYGYYSTVKYKEVEVEGEVKYEGWSFVAVLDHHKEGNVVRAYNTELAIPDRYKTCGPTCEHCNKIRSRKDTYIIHNKETGEFKQVGKSCLLEYTQGLSAEDVAFFCSVYEQVEKLGSYSGPNFNRYLPVEEILHLAFECFKHWGYQKSANSIEGIVPDDYRSTSARVSEYYNIERQIPPVKEKLLKEMQEVGFNAASEYAVESAKAALEWIRNTTPNNEYIRNLHVICSDEYVDYRSLGILVSLTISYARHIEQVAAYEKKQKAHEEAVAVSEYVGNKGDKLVIKASDFKCVSSWEGMYGLTFLYKFKDESGNSFTWFASRSVENEDRVIEVAGTVKDHSEYQGLKETILTRCKVKLAPVEEVEHEPATCDAAEAIDLFLEELNN